MNKRTDIGLVLEISDGPEYSPNFKRTVKVISRGSVDGFYYCRDMKTGEIVQIYRHKIEQAKEKAKL